MSLFSIQDFGLLLSSLGLPIYWQNCPTVLFDEDQTLRGLIHEPELNLSILTEAYISLVTSTSLIDSEGKLKVIS